MTEETAGLSAAAKKRRRQKAAAERKAAEAENLAEGVEKLNFSPDSRVLPFFSLQTCAGQLGHCDAFQRSFERRDASPRGVNNKKNKLSCK